MLKTVIEVMFVQFVTLLELCSIYVVRRNESFE